jgi:pimeloyl-ACP methyl ester carboxylesterase
MRFDASYQRSAARWPTGSTSVEVPTSWGTTHVLTAGPPEAPGVLLLHGDGATATAWADLAAQLAPRYRVLAPDQPGNPGRSGSTRPFRSTSDLVSWLAEVHDASGARVRHLAGHSAGAHLALSYALSSGDRLTTLTLLDPTFAFTGMSPRYLAHALPSLLRPTERRVRRFLAWETRGRGLPAAWLDTYVYGAVDLARTPIVRTRRPAVEQLAALSVPTLVVVAANGRAHDASRLSARAAALPAVTVLDVPRATHHTMPLLDAPVIGTAMTAHLDTAEQPPEERRAGLS